MEASTSAKSYAGAGGSEDEEMARAKAIEENSIINISLGIADGNARVIVKAKRPAPRTADDYLMIEDEDVALTEGDNAPTSYRSCCCHGPSSKTAKTVRQGMRKTKLHQTPCLRQKSVITCLDPRSLTAPRKRTCRRTKASQPFLEVLKTVG